MIRVPPVPGKYDWERHLFCYVEILSPNLIAGYKLYISNRYTQYAMHRATKYNSESVHMLRLWTKIATILPNPSQNWRLTFRFIAVFKIKLPPLLIKGSVMPPAKVFAKRTAGNYTIANG